MSLPKDPIMLLSVVNTQLRDRYSSLAELAASNMVEESEIVEKLKAVGYEYNPDRNQFV